MTSENHLFILNQIAPLLETAANQYNQLLLITGGTWRERTNLLKYIAAEKGYAYLALGLPLSRTLLGRPIRDRPLVLADHISTLLSPRSEAGVVLDHIEILFDPSLHTDPLRLLQFHARSRLVVASWPGSYGRNRLIYAEPGHPEYYSQAITGLLTYSLEVTDEIS